jgi:hypothetical protein
MEDDDESDSEQFIEENYAFKSLKSLTENENVAFLAVFLNFILSNSDPAPLLFYLISDLYKDGNAKDMRKWAYEIHSTFLVPTAVSAFKLIINRYGTKIIRCVREVPRGFAPCTFLVPPILAKFVFLDSARTKLSESDPLS